MPIPSRPFANKDIPLSSEETGFTDMENHSPPHPEMVDMDHDGDMDISVSSEKKGVNYWLENTLDEKGNRFLQHSIFKQITPTAIGYGDLNGDDVPDIVLGHISGAKVFMDNGKWEMTDLSLSLQSPRAILIEDIDGDYRKDLLIRDSHDFFLIKNLPGLLGSQILSWPNLGNSNVLSVGNFNVATVSLEILTMDEKNGTLVMIEHDGRHWQPAKVVTETTVRTLSAHDFDNDGFTDVIIGNENGDISLLKNDGTGNFTRIANSEKADFDIPVEHFETAGGTWDNFHGFPSEELDGVQNVLSPPMHGFEWSHAPRFTVTSSTSGVEIPDTSFLKTLPDDSFSIEKSDSYTSSDLLPFTASVISEQEKDQSGTEQGSDTIQRADDSDAQLPLPTAGEELREWGLETHEQNDMHSIQGRMVDGSSLNDLYVLGHDNDSADGNQGSDFIFGKGGNDTLTGGEGNDALFGGDGRDALFGDADDDYLRGNNGSDALVGGEGDDYLNGGKGDDLLFGGQGDDFLFGDSGDDTLYGGNGQDTFYYHSPQEGTDTIRDFNLQEDLFVFDFEIDTYCCVRDEYDGSLGTNGSALIWAVSEDGTADLYYDSDTSQTGGEYCIAHVELTDGLQNETCEELTPDDILS
ncbi:FG-GAP-like repeat-containing protein [uncultured Pseudodesulfovibrio sp.]|uniref:FG-GAP-like repeat-containing protein n=1 Tax=uncultured Pseudodesulfovibrio sp. TaxID=2035858 RepID=UPI0029C78DC8|nr:FG-GAP-like repeat-containing protein [uncultured Pseudodesulfovibrio sp.]